MGGPETQTAVAVVLLNFYLKADVTNIVSPNIYFWTYHQISELRCLIFGQDYFNRYSTSDWCKKIDLTTAWHFEPLNCQLDFLWNHCNNKNLYHQKTINLECKRPIFFPLYVALLKKIETVAKKNSFFSRSSNKHTHLGRKWTIKKFSPEV